LEAAQADWRIVVQLADHELAADQDDAAALHWKAWALVRLGDMKGAKAICAQIQENNLESRALIFRTTSISPLWVTVGMPDLAIAELRKGLLDGAHYGITRAMLELNPAYDPLRTDPRFLQMLAWAPAPKE
jgi:hypothetical protein